VDADVPMVPGHVDALGRALTNVLLNAVEAGPPGAPLEVQVRRALHDGRPMVEVAVRDTGCGIPAPRMARIWEPYVTHKPGGTGLGLAIVRQTVVAHGGSVAAESVPGAGTTIRLFLPEDPAVTEEMTTHAE
jgi:signal transduction histidine kinase